MDTDRRLYTRVETKPASRGEAGAFKEKYSNTPDTDPPASPRAPDTAGDRGGAQSPAG